MPSVIADLTDPQQNEKLWVEREGSEFSLTIWLCKNINLRCSTLNNISILIIWLEHRKLLKASLEKKKKSSLLDAYLQRSAKRKVHFVQLNLLKTNYISSLNQNVLFDRCEQAKACQKENQKLWNNLEQFFKTVLTIAAHSTEIAHLDLGSELSQDIKVEKKTSQ